MKTSMPPPRPLGAVVSAGSYTGRRSNALCLVSSSGACGFFGLPSTFPAALRAEEDGTGGTVSVLGRDDEQQTDGGGGGSRLAAVSNAMVALHKEQFGRGPTRARSHFAGEDTLVCVLEGALLPAEQALVEMNQQVRVQEARLFFQMATRGKFVDAVEEIVGRKVIAFSSATDADATVVWELYNFEPRPGTE